MRATIVVIGLAGLALIVGSAMGLPRDSLYFFAGGTLLLATLATLAFQRMVLARYEHLLFPAPPGRAVPLYGKLHSKIHGLDRWGLFLTIGFALYTVIFAVYLAVQLYEAVISDVFHAFRHV